MKRLVDILAKGLKSWPEGVAAITQGIGTGVLRDSSHQQFRPEIYLELASDAGFADYGQPNSAIVSRAEWQAAVDALNAPKVVEWAKGSLPPIGSVVEWDGCAFAAEDPQEKDLHVGDQVTIIAHLKDGDFEIAAFTFNPSIHNAARGRVWVNQGASGCFRPVRTAEQVAAEEREKDAQSLFELINPEGKWHKFAEEGKSRFRSAVDAGYRKQVAK